MLRCTHLAAVADLYEAEGDPPNETTERRSHWTNAGIVQPAWCPIALCLNSVCLRKQRLRCVQ